MGCLLNYLKINIQGSCFGNTKFFFQVTTVHECNNCRLVSLKMNIVVGFQVLDEFLVTHYRLSQHTNNILLNHGIE